MHQVLLSLGANYDAERNLSEVLVHLGQIIVFTRVTPAIWTEPFNSNSKRMYLNQLVKGDTSLTITELESAIKKLETAAGRTSEMRSQGLVPLDIDILEFDSERHHLHDWERPYVQQLLPCL